MGVEVSLRHYTVMKFSGFVALFVVNVMEQQVVRCAFINPQACTDDFCKVS